MKLLFIVTSFWAYGELLIALEFAKSCKDNHMQVHFIIPPTHKKILENNKISFTCLIPQSRKINCLLMQDLETSWKPDYVILSDFLNYHFCEKHYGLKFEDLQLFSGKIGTFDNFDWRRPRTQMDTYGFKSDTVRNVDINQYGFQLLPVPIVNINQESLDKDQMRYAVLRETLPYNEVNKIKSRQELGLPSDKKIVLTTVATWQQGYKAYRNVKEFIDLSDWLFQTFLEELATEYLVICVGRLNKESVYSEITQKSIDSGQLKLLDSLSPEIFNLYALSCDLFITRNITSTTTIKLLLSKVPCIQINNTFENQEQVLSQLHGSLSVSLQNQINQCPYFYQYEMYPVGWYQFLKGILENNPYKDLISRVEQFDWIHMKETVEKLLYDHIFREERNKEIDCFNKAIDNLPKPFEIIKYIYRGKCDG